VQEGAKEYSVSRNAEDYYVPAKKICSAPTAGEMMEWLMRQQSNMTFQLWFGTNTYHVDHRAGSDLVSTLAAFVLEALA